MISIDNAMSDMAQIEAAQAAYAPPEMPSADTGQPVGDDTKEAEAAVADDADEQETGDEVGSDDDADTDAKPKSNPKNNGYRRKIFIRDQEIAALKAQVEALAVGGVKPADEREPQYQPQSTEGKPTLAQFDGDLDKFSEALYDWKEQQKGIEAKAKQQADAWQSRVEKAAEKYEDFAEVVNKPLSILKLPDVVEFLMDSEVGADIGYMLAKNDTEAQRIVGLTLNQRAKALAKLELQITGTLPPPVQQKTKASAPPPIKPLAGGSTASVVKDPRRSDMTFQEHNAWRNSGGK